MVHKTRLKELLNHVNNSLPVFTQILNILNGFFGVKGL
jgi:hypothetical protein